MHICAICGSRDHHAQYQPRERMYGWDRQFEYFRCHNCGCLQINTPPDDLPSFYPADYYAHEYQAATAPGWLQRNLNWLRLRYRLTGRGAWAETLSWRLGALSRTIQQQIPYLKRIPGLNRNSRILDLGCGTHSAWLFALRLCGFRHLTGADPFLEHPGRRNGIRYLQAEIDTLDGQFDLITLHHALEHIPDQHAVFQALHRLLDDNGICMIRIPLIDSQVWDEYGLDWVELDAPRHLYLHTRKSLGHLAHTYGFEVIETYCDSTAFEFAGSEQYRQSIPLMAPESFWNNPETGPFNSTQMEDFSNKARAANLSSRCGRAAFFLRRCST